MTFFRDENKNIAIIDPDGSVRSATTIIEIIKKLEKSGYQCDIYTPRRYHSAIEVSENTFICPRSFPSVQIPNRDFFRGVRDWVESLLGITQTYAMQYRYAIGINPEGIIIADAKFNFDDLIYLSFELFSENDTSSVFFKKVKKMERKASQNACLIVSQDSTREAFLRKNLGLFSTPFVNFPVAPSYMSIDRPRLPLDITRRINVVISGSISAFTRAQLIMASVSDWPHNFTLIVNSNSSSSKKIGVDSRIENIEFTEGNLSEDEYVKLLDSMDIGIVGYSPVTGSNPFLMTNIELMGLSSGKLGVYTRSGLPIVLIGYPFPEDLLSEYDFAISINDESQLPAALEELVVNYCRHSSESRRFFDEVLNFDNHWPQFSGVLKIG